MCILLYQAVRAFCLHFNTKKKILRIFKKKFVDFQDFKTFYKTFKTHFFIFIILKPSLWSRDVPQKIWAKSVQPFFGYKQTDRQAKFIYRLCFQGASRPSSILIVNMLFLFIFQNKEEKNFADLKKIVNFSRIKFFLQN